MTNNLTYTVGRDDKRRRRNLAMLPNPTNKIVNMQYVYMCMYLYPTMSTCMRLSLCIHTSRNNYGSTETVEYIVNIPDRSYQQVSIDVVLLAASLTWREVGETISSTDGLKHSGVAHAGGTARGAKRTRVR